MKAGISRLSCYSRITGRSNTISMKPYHKSQTVKRLKPDIDHVQELTWFNLTCGGRHNGPSASPTGRWPRWPVSKRSGWRLGCGGAETRLRGKKKKEENDIAQKQLRWDVGMVEQRYRGWHKQKKRDGADWWGRLEQRDEEENDGRCTPWRRWNKKTVRSIDQWSKIPGGTLSSKLHIIEEKINAAVYWSEYWDPE